MITLLFFSTLYSFNYSLASSVTGCELEMKNHCKNLKPYNGDSTGCLLERYSSLSPKCQENLKEKEKNSPCFTDTINLCKGSELKYSNISSCLVKNFTKLSPKCASWYNKAKKVGSEREAKVKAACASEWKRCENEDFRKQRDCMKDLSAKGEMTNQCKSIFDKMIRG